MIKDGTRGVPVLKEMHRAHHYKIEEVTNIYVCMCVSHTHIYTCIYICICVCM